MPERPAHRPRQPPRAGPAHGPQLVDSATASAAPRSQSRSSTSTTSRSEVNDRFGPRGRRPGAGADGTGCCASTATTWMRSCASAKHESSSSSSPTRRWPPPPDICERLRRGRGHDWSAIAPRPGAHAEHRPGLDAAAREPIDLISGPVRTRRYTAPRKPGATGWRCRPDSTGSAAGRRPAAMAGAPRPDGFRA